MNDTILHADNLTKHFGVLPAVQNVSLLLKRGVLHAIIGPNGAGKTTLINLLSGELHPDQGAIRYRNKEITQLLPDQISRLGIGRSYQKINIIPSFTCFENCQLAAQSRLITFMGLFCSGKQVKELHERTEKALEMVHLSHRNKTAAATMSYGEQRQLELAMILATEPELLLLDEPLAGMGNQESNQIIELLQKLAKQHTLLLVEHDMDAVFAIAQQLTVMVNGKILETGTSNQIRNSDAVQKAYLGNNVIMKNEG
ncbi:MAG: ABC transporter ATP-binding protein [SAR324 cluster bacterium]|nr:ABC transporter ATP-binding protein [SAR324 cluster bacterium]